MIVNNVHSAANLYSVGATRYASSVASKKAASFKDDFKMSVQAASFKDMLRKIHNEPEVRQDKVEELTRQIESGSYDVSAENIAASILSVRF